MLELSILACLLDNPGKCKEVSLVYMSESVTPMPLAMSKTLMPASLLTVGHRTKAITVPVSSALTKASSKR